ncbi:hypothetical protein [Deinococcus budaensis]|uniref:Integral membrane protein n=1 Tax=Deinococcus budaensis TaxID=1665626 RepID=A0A7W8GG51_9DEIO|nr:hypothetical protein [Deinococcus budaensis]MBB5234571.1 hypothetical protein [Deinococcus budaensis]
MLEALARDLHAGAPADLTRAARRAQALAFAALAAPGVPLGLLYLLTRPAPLAPAWVAALALLGAALALLPLRLSRRAARDPAGPPARAALTAALQAAAAPAVPFLLGCACLAQPAAVLSLWSVAALAFALARAGVPGWVREASLRRG